mmetsp:Transcript_120575/g.240084  ORF Transcript_120575/g.240084 Transcript_120575/m.240084 type:complete len:158 (-) Transcript_120575:160-633(-)|eukprot:CAMPEP_0172721660 /NCGR_PEP_ID=MMETSP1074-20121228/79613_1 /TAXON_ID=2916 /ORGANISM="Ceratium fusus, Strain PA161109" /LENGTH=157 /DNA_ID=CAMNT_0013547453 /DNA_START=91 /DNA_END=564 /DNA_ORIENTATION=+
MAFRSLVFAYASFTSACVVAQFAFLQKHGSQEEVHPCPGDTREDGRCNKDDTHRVCAKIGVDDTSFWTFTGQSKWCGEDIYGTGAIACPPEKPTWCICKWATARWIQGEGCTDSVQFDCSATDVCNLKKSYTDNGTELKPAHDCMKTKCKTEWDACS